MDETDNKSEISINESLDTIETPEMTETMTNLDSIMTDDLMTDTESMMSFNSNKKPKTFRERCEDDPAFKKKCADRLSRKVICEICDMEISRSSVNKHNRTKRHREIQQMKIDAEARAKVKYDIIVELDYIRKKLLKPDDFKK